MKRWNRIARGPERLRTRAFARVKKAFLCTRTMGVSAPPLHGESTDSLIVSMAGVTYPGDALLRSSLCGVNLLRSEFSSVHVIV